MKKIIYSICITIIFIIMGFGITYANIVYLGDANLDGKIDISDSLKIQRYIASVKGQEREEWNLTQEQLKQADTDGNGIINITDLLNVQRYIAAKKSEVVREKHPEWITKLEKEVEEPEEEILPEGITLSETQVILEKGSTKTLTAAITPTNATNKNVTWTSSNYNIVTVNEQGTITAVGVGEATITATTANGKTATCKVIVQESRAPELKITNSEDTENGEDHVIKAGDTITYTITTNDTTINEIDKSKIIIDTEIEGYSYTISDYNSLNRSIEVQVRTTDSINSVGMLKLDIQEGFLTNASNKTSSSYIRYDYVASLNVSPSENSIGTTVGVANSFYIKDYDFYLDNTKKEGNRTTNEYIYSNLVANTNHNIKVNVEFYISKLNDITFSGFIEKSNVRTTSEGGNQGVEVHYIDVSDDPAYIIKNGTKKYVIDYTNSGFTESKGTSADAIFIKTGDGKTVLIDTGAGEKRNKDGAKAIDKYLISNGLVTSLNGYVDIDYLVMTHRDSDHSGGFFELAGISGTPNTIDIRYRFKNVIIGINEKQIYENVVNDSNRQQYTNYSTEYNTEKKLKCIFNHIYTQHNLNSNYWNIKFVTAGNSITVGTCILNIFNPYPVEDVPNEFLTSIIDGNGNETTGIRQGAYVVNNAKLGEATLNKIGEGYCQTTHTWTNNGSIVVKLINGSRKTLFMGDSGFYTEEILLGKVAEEIKENKGKMEFGTCSQLGTWSERKSTKYECKIYICNPNKSPSSPYEELKGGYYGTSGLEVDSSNSYVQGDTVKVKTTLNLVQDILYSGICKDAKEIEDKYNLSRLTAKDISAQVLKKGHHGLSNTTSVPFLDKVHPNKIVTTGILKYQTPLIKYLDYGADYRVRLYYEGIGRSLTEHTDSHDKNWYNNVYGASASIYSPSFIAQTGLVKNTSNLYYYKSDDKSMLRKKLEEDPDTLEQYRGGLCLRTTGEGWTGYAEAYKYIHNMFYYNSGICESKKQY